MTKISIRTDRIVEIRFEINEYEVGVKEQMEMHDAIAKLTHNGKVAYHILVVPGKYGSVSKEAREMEMFETVAFENHHSIAMVVYGFPQRILGKLYFVLKKSKPKFPYNFFNSEETALNWIVSQK